MSMLQEKMYYSYCCSFYGWQLWDISSNYIEDSYVAWQTAIRRIFNLSYTTHRYLLLFVFGLPSVPINLVNICNNFVDALLSCGNNIIELLVHKCNLNNTPLGLNRKLMNMYSCSKCSEFWRSSWSTAFVILNVQCRNWSGPQYNKDEIELCSMVKCPNRLNM